MHRSVLIAVLVPALCLLAGCCCWGPSEPPLPDTLPELEQVALDARDRARAAEDARAAAAAADRAEAALAKAETLAADGSGTGGEGEASGEEGTGASERPDPLAAIRAAAAEARHMARLAHDREQVAAQCRGIKHGAYFGARSVALTAAFEGLALAARKADEGGFEALPEDAKPAAELAADLAERLSGRARLPDGERDWAGIAADMTALRQEPPPRLGLVLAAGFLLTARDGLALYEIEAVDPAQLASPDEVVGYHVLRGLICRLNGYSTLARVELQIAAELAGADAEEGALAAEQAQAALHLLLAVLFITEKDHARADLEIVRAMKAWPNNPLAVFLTGERLAADGRLEEAADSLERWAEGTRNEELAAIVAERARALRDAEGPPEPLLHDATFVRLLVQHLLAEAARESPAVKKVSDAVASAKAFGARVLAKLPGDG